MSTLLMPVAPAPTLESCMVAALDVCRSVKTRYHYHAQMLKFLDSRQPLTRAGVIAWMASYPDNTTRTLRFFSVLLLAREAHLQGLIDDKTLAAIDDIPRPVVPQRKAGNWLSYEDSKRLMKLPNMSVKHGCRDAAMLAILLGCGMRASEMLELNWVDYQCRDGRMVWLDFTGKGGKTRTVPIPEWVDKRVRAWKVMQPGGSEYGIYGHYRVFEMSYPALVQRIARYSKLLNRKFSAHDLRRTHARLMRGCGVSLEQIQLTLGHSSVKTTEIYLGSKLEMGKGKAGVDQIDLDAVEEEEITK